MTWNKIYKSKKSVKGKTLLFNSAGYVFLWAALRLAAQSVFTARTAGGELLGSKLNRVGSPHHRTLVITLNHFRLPPPPFPIDLRLHPLTWKISVASEPLTAVLGLPLTENSKNIEPITGLLSSGDGRATPWECFYGCQGSLLGRRKMNQHHDWWGRSAQPSCPLDSVLLLLLSLDRHWLTSRLLTERSKPTRKEPSWSLFCFT